MISKTIPSKTKSPKLSDTQLIILSDASQRPDGIIIIPARLKGNAGNMAFNALLRRGLIEGFDYGLAQMDAPTNKFDGVIDLVPASADEPRGGLDHFCLSIRCDDLGKAADALRRRGVALDSDVVDRRGAFGRGPSLYIRDPDGSRIELKPR